MPQYDYKLLVSKAQHVANASANGTNQIDLGYSALDPNISKSGEFGAHVVVTQAFTNTTPTFTIWLMHGQTTANTKIIGRYFAGAKFTLRSALFHSLPSS